MFFKGVSSGEKKALGRTLTQPQGTEQYKVMFRVFFMIIIRVLIINVTLLSFFPCHVIPLNFLYYNYVNVAF